MTIVLIIVSVSAAAFCVYLLLYVQKVQKILHLVLPGQFPDAGIP